MDRVFSEVGISALDFIQISTGFLLTMLFFFGLRAKRHVRLNYFILTVFALQGLIIIFFRGGLTVKLFAALMLTTTLIVEGVAGRRRRPGDAEEPASGSRA